MSDELARRLGYYLFKPDGTMDAKVINPPINNECRVEFDSITRILFDLAPVCSAFEIAKASLEDLHKTMDEIQLRVSNMFAGPFDGMKIMHDAHVVVQQRVMSFLSNARSFLDHTSTALKRLYGKDNELSEFNRFCAHTRRLYDTHFSYRLCYELRNMSQHVALPISVFNINADRLTKDGQLVYAIELRVDRNHLLSEWKNWKSIVRKDLQAQVPQLNLLPILDEELNHLRELSRAILFQHSESIKLCMRYLEALLKIVSPPVDAVPVFWVGKFVSPGTNPPPHMEILPMEQAMRLIRIVSE